MNTEHVESLARLSPALHDTDCDFNARGGLRAVRAEAVRQLRWLQRASARSLNTPTPNAPRPFGSSIRARRPDEKEVPRQMGEDVPSWFD